MRGHRSGIVAGASANAFLPGSIVRVKLTNFVTFDAVEFFPGPNLNFVIGPNGSGKSTLVSAICLGLGGKPTILNKDKKLNTFVKLGCNEAIVEVEIQGRDEANPVLRREFGKDDSTSVWYLNGNKSTEKKVLEVVASYDIQVGNLCQFLPQDRVYDFVRMEAEEILKETEKAAGDKTMFAEHEDLIKLCAEEFTSADQFKNEKDVLDNLVRRNASIEGQVRLLKERQITQQKLHLCEIKKLWVLYEQARRRHVEIEETRRALKAQLQRFEEENVPLMEELRNKEEQKKGLEAKKKEMNEKSKNATKAVDDAIAKIEQQERRIDELYKDITSVKENHEKKLRELEKQERSVKSIADQLEKAEEPDITPIADQLKVIGETLVRNQNEIAQIQSDMRDLQKQIDTVLHSKNERERELNMIDDVANQRLEVLRTVAADTYKAVLWLRKNAGEFRGKVYEPPCLSINVVNPNYASEVEASLPFGALTCFIVEDQEDQARLHEKLRQMQLRYTIYTLPKQQDFSPSREAVQQMKSAGFEHFIFDLIDASPEIKSVLCDQAQIHRIPVTKKNIDASNIPDAFRRFFINGYQYNISRSLYGNKARLTSQDPIRPAKMLRASTDNARRQACVLALQDINRQLTNLEEDRLKLNRKDDDVRKADAPVREQKARLTNRKTELMAEIKRINALKASFGTEKNRLKRLQDEISKQNVETEEAEKRREAAQETKKRADLALKAASMHMDILSIYRDRSILMISVSEADAALAVLQQRYEQQSAELIRLRTEYERVLNDQKALKTAAKEALERARSAPLTDEEKRELEALPSVFEDLEVLIAELQATLRVASTTSDNVVQEYENRQLEIQRLEGILKNKEAELNAKRERLQTLRTTWAPRVEALISKISQSFSEYMQRLGNIGEVHLEQPVDYNKWKVQIKVKFRPSEPLSVLESTHHSGGERTVATILYLMSLQDMARSPFRLVDEINQGMDKHNERGVHKEIVSTATRPNTPQYFLITPKLLTDLVYNDKMKVHCVHNGHHQPSHEQWSLDRFLQNRRQATATAN